MITASSSIPHACRTFYAKGSRNVKIKLYGKGGMTGRDSPWTRITTGMPAGVLKRITPAILPKGTRKQNADP